MAEQHETREDLRIVGLERDCTRLEALLRKEGKALPPTENADREAAKATQERRTEVWLGQRLIDLKNSLLYATA